MCFDPKSFNDAIIDPQIVGSIDPYDPNAYQYDIGSTPGDEQSLAELLSEPKEVLRGFEIDFDPFAIVATTVPSNTQFSTYLAEAMLGPKRDQILDLAARTVCEATDQLADVLDEALAAGDEHVVLPVGVAVSLALLTVR